MQRFKALIIIMITFFLAALLITAEITLAGSAADIAKYTAILQDGGNTSQERSFAAQQLGFVGTDSVAAAQTLTDALSNDADTGVRKSAARALGMVGLPDSAYIQALIQALENDDSPEVRSAAAEGLALIGQNSAAAVQALKNAADNDSSAEVRHVASGEYNKITDHE